MTRPDWAIIKNYYIKGTYDSKGHPVDITLTDVAERYGIAIGNLWKKVKKENWEQQRIEYKAKIIQEEQDYEEKIRAELRKAGLPEYTQFMAQIGKLCYGMIGKFTQRLASPDSNYTPRFSEVLLAIDKLDHIIRFIEGREKGKVVDVDFTWHDMILSLSQGIEDPNE